jgi:hypothetical protein
VGRRTAREHLPALRRERDLTALPCAPPHVHRRLEERELVRPRREAAVAAEAVELGEDGDERVVGALVRQVVVIAAAQVRHRRAAAGDLEPRGAQEQRVELLDRLGALGAGGAEPLEPPPALRIEVVEGRGRNASGTGWHERVGVAPAPGLTRVRRRAVGTQR